MSLSALPTLLIVPPLNLLIAACAGALLWRRRVGRWLLRAGLLGLVLLSLPYVSGNLIASLERDLPTMVDAGDPPGAIVVLSANSELVLTPQGPGVTVGRLTLERERQGASLARASGLPILVSGGQLGPGEPSIASLMAASLQVDFGIHAQWQEASSLDTWQNAAFSAGILRAADVGTVYVVTHAWHMRRALIAFRAAGLHAVAYPVWREAPPRLQWIEFLPRVAAWEQSYYAIHEWIGCAWYGLRA